MSQTIEENRSHESHETLPLAGEVLLITGASRGTGKLMANVAHQLGADVLIGSRSAENYHKAVDEIGEQRLHPFIADLTKPDEVIAATDRMFGEGLHPTAIVQCSAGGMEHFIPKIAMPFVRAVRTYRSGNTDEAKTRLVELNRQIAGFVERDWEFAMGTNYRGPMHLVEEVLRRKDPQTPITYIDYSSIYSSLVDEVPPPPFYRGVATSKGAFEQYLLNNAQRLIGLKLYPAIISGAAMRDTPVGELFEKYVMPLMTDEDRQIFEAGFITMADMVNATVNILRSDHATWESYPLKRFLVGNNVTNTLSPADPIMHVKTAI